MIIIRARAKFKQINFGGYMPVKIWEVGGHVRDSLLGISSKDIDMAVEASDWNEMREFVFSNSKKVFLERPDFFTIRALGNDGLPKDFILCIDSQTNCPGTILDDLSRRDFTVNAIARNAETGEILDPFDGQSDLKNMSLRAVKDTEERFGEDPIRILRALRFFITRGFSPDEKILNVFKSSDWAKSLNDVSVERIRDELFKCFNHDTVKTMNALVTMFDLEFSNVIFDSKMGLWLRPTTEK